MISYKLKYGIRIEMPVDDPDISAVYEITSPNADLAEHLRQDLRDAYGMDRTLTDSCRAISLDVALASDRMSKWNPEIVEGKEILEKYKPLKGEDGQFFAARRPRKGRKVGKGKKNCNKGVNCGGTCISAKKTCRKDNPSEKVKAKAKSPKKSKGGGGGFAEYEAQADELSRELKSLEQTIAKENKDLNRMWDEGRIEEGLDLLNSPARKRLVQANEEFSALMEAYRAEMIGRSRLSDADALELAKKTKLTGYTKKQKTEITAAIADFHRLTNGVGDGKIQTIVAKPERAGTDAAGNIFIDKITFTNAAFRGKNVLYHEMAHNLEDTAQRKRNNSWIASRSKNNAKLEKLQDLAPGEGYGPDELAVRGDFYHPYVGKFYGASPVDIIGGKQPQVKNATSPTEVLSMGLEKFVDGKQMAELYRGDKQHFRLMTDYLEEARV